MIKALYVRFGSTGCVVLAGVAATVVVAGPAQAASCAGPVRYTATSNAVYLTGGGSFTPSQIVAACPDAPLKLVDASSRTWELAADLIVQQGSTLSLKGTKRGGDVNQLRIRSLASNKATEVQQITALYGTIDIDSVQIMSWNGEGPDTDVKVPAGAQSTDRGRAFIRAVSILGSNGKAQLSKMNIRDSTLSYLGYFAGESYGVAYKSRGCDRDHVAACKKLKVTGQQLNSTFHHNYMGTYTWGANGMVFRGNTYRDNITYGLDPHDVSSNLTIDRNRFLSNGNHGLICSQLCDKLTITNNTSDGNGARNSGAPVAAIGDGDEVESMVHGIMLHRGVKNTKITGNTVSNNTGAGIAIFDSTNNTVSNNKMIKNRYGIRLTVGSAKNTFSNNTITASFDHAIYLYPGTDAAQYSTAGGRPTGNTFKNTTVNGTGSYGIRVQDADKTTITGRSMTSLGAALLFNRVRSTSLSKVTLPAKQPIIVSGTAALRSTLTLTVPRSAVTVNADRYSTVAYR